MFNSRHDVGHGTLFHGLQNSHYNLNGRHWRRDLDGNNFYGLRPAPRRNQRRIIGRRGPRGAYRYGYGSDSNSNNNRVKYKNSIKWEEQTVNNLPTDPITLNAFSNGQKAVKIHPTANHYMSPQTFRRMALMSMADAFNTHGNTVLFQNPLTRQNVRRSNIKFVVLKNKNTGRATKAKKNAANKIGDARRRQLTRRSTLARAKAVTTALKRKRSQ